MRIAQMLLTTDGAILFIYGIVSLLFVPSSAGEPYLSSGRILYGILPSALGLASVACADSTTATSNVYGFSNSSSVVGDGFSSASRRKNSKTWSRFT